MIYHFKRAEELATQRPYKPRLEYGLIPKELVKYMEAGWNGINL